MHYQLTNLCSKTLKINNKTLSIVRSFVLAMRFSFVETKRYMDFKAPHSQGAEDSFFGLEPVLQGLEPGYGKIEFTAELFVKIYGGISRKM
jgi:uncharacterized beta-barrel protein YwiB (DUF1934 family)